MNEQDNLQSSKRRLGEILLDLGIITEEQLAHALMIQREERRLLGQVLIKLGYVAPETIISALDMQDVSIFETNT